MLIVPDVEARNEITDAVLCVANPDGTWTVYQVGDVIPPQFQQP